MKFSFLRFNTRSVLKKNKTNRASLPYKQALNMGIIFSVEDKTKHEEVKEFIRKLEQDGKRVQVISYLPPKKENIDFKFDFFSEKDLTFWGNIQSASALQFADTPFDFLFCLDSAPHPMILNLLARSKANCRVGSFADDHMTFFEMMIETKSDIGTFIKQIYAYTAGLR